MTLAARSASPEAMHFLIVAPSFHEWDLGTYVTRLLRAKGYACDTFAYRDGGGAAPDASADRRLLATAADARPRVVVGLKMETIAPSTLKTLRADGALVALWYVDCFDGRVPEEMAQRIPAVDLFLTNAKGMVPRYERVSDTPVHWLHEGVYLPAFPTLKLPAAQRSTYGSEVAFVGNLFQPPVEDSSLALRRFRLLGEVCRRHELKIWGPQGNPTARTRWDTKRCPLMEWPAYNEELVKICLATDVVLGLNTVNDVELYFSNRTFLTLASGGFHLTHYVPGLETMFENHRHLVWFSTDEECLELLAYYLARPEERRCIAEAGRAWTRRRYGMSRQVNKLLRIIGERLDG